jgi:hypothetical protein
VERYIEGAVVTEATATGRGGKKNHPIIRSNIFERPEPAEGKRTNVKEHIRKEGCLLTTVGERREWR